MNNSIDNIDFINSVNRILQEFVTTKMEEIHNELVYVVFDQQDIMNIFQQGLAPPRVTFHFWRETPQSSAKTYIGQGKQGERVYLSFSVFCVLNDELCNGQKPSIVIDRMCAYVKNLFDSHIQELDMFDGVKCNYPKDKLSKVADNTYAKSFDLSFRVIKEIV